MFDVEWRILAACSLKCVLFSAILDSPPRGGLSFWRISLLASIAPGGKQRMIFDIAPDNLSDGPRWVFSRHFGLSQLRCS